MRVFDFIFVCSGKVCLCVCVWALTVQSQVSLFFSLQKSPVSVHIVALISLIFLSVQPQKAKFYAAESLNMYREHDRKPKEHLKSEGMYEAKWKSPDEATVNQYMNGLNFCVEPLRRYI